MGAFNRSALVATVIWCQSGSACSHEIPGWTQPVPIPTSDAGARAGGDEAGTGHGQDPADAGNGSAEAGAASDSGRDAATPDLGSLDAGGDAGPRSDAAADAGTSPNDASGPPLGTCRGRALDGGGSRGDGGTPDSLVIDDFDDGDLHIPRTDGRFGIWSWEGGEDHGSIELNALEPPRGCGARIVNEFASDKAAFGVNLFDGQAYPKAAEYAGISFWTKVGEFGAPWFRVELLTTDTSSEHGGDDDNASIHFDLRLEPGEWRQQWRLVRLLWNDAEQEGWGAPYDFDPEKLTGLLFRHGGAGSEVNFWLDDVRFIPKSLDAAGDAGPRSDAAAGAGKPDAGPNDAGGPPLGKQDACDNCSPCRGPALDGGGSPADPGWLDRLLIDDFADGDLCIPGTDGRSGVWAWEDLPPGAPPNLLHIELPTAEPAWGRGAHVWVSKNLHVPPGHGFGVELSKGLAYHRAADYVGISLWVKRGPEGPDEIRVELPTTDTYGESGADLYNAGIDYAGLDVDLDSEWQQVRLIWGGTDPDLQNVDSPPNGFDPAELTGLLIRPKHGYLNFWLDEVRFIEFLVAKE